MASRRALEEYQASVPVSAGLECCICYHAYFPTSMGVDAEMPMQLPCGHVFGEKCISKWTSTKNTCPLCRRELFLPGSSHKDDDVWVGPDLATRNLGSTSVAASFEPQPPHEQFRISEVELSLARTSTAAHHCFEHHPGPCSALHQHAGQYSRSYTRRARESSHRRTFVAYLQTGDVWNTSLADHMDDSAVTVDEDIWLTLLNEDEYASLPYLRETPLYELYQQDELLDSAFEELVIDHAQWMKEVEEEAEILALDRLATSYDICVR
ncbi:HRD1, HRD ubiquitin ligase complex, ER membrane component [Pyrenophora tritici-repentis]|uniref:E3 ubiquitin-protein ligase RNF13 n=1 Tax=Pyrenophora tritici-repentis TaxID=45151 RepID=A0A2W1GWL0_9PLEO|nr:E3 ubiquitin-protein ligase RNF13 [Pyrenophora tritici-repentis]KAI1673125.1 E3 ubiquitin-protein ligase RNF13 [Pyrenophora tritici-repentis]KAI1677042.1 E3 ubiquitin-protein ligase RNF13 [Pyrenophora tritici-repentis]PZD41033.1 HRD1, HRD ubiquitin ligase complex, ER membrane component [Pyrenophora tritici-repentis]